MQGAWHSPNRLPPSMIHGRFRYITPPSHNRLPVRTEQLVGYGFDCSIETNVYILFVIMPHKIQILLRFNMKKGGIYHTGLYKINMSFNYITLILPSAFLTKKAVHRHNNTNSCN